MLQLRLSSHTFAIGNLCSLPELHLLLLDHGGLAVGGVGACLVSASDVHALCKKRGKCHSTLSSYSQSIALLAAAL